MIAETLFTPEVPQEGRASGRPRMKRRLYSGCAVSGRAQGPGPAGRCRGVCGVRGAPRGPGPAGRCRGVCGVWGAWGAWPSRQVPWRAWGARPSWQVPWGARCPGCARGARPSKPTVCRVDGLVTMVISGRQVRPAKGALGRRTRPPAGPSSARRGDAAAPWAPGRALPERGRSGVP